MPLSLLPVAGDNIGIIGPAPFREPILPLFPYNRYLRDAHAICAPVLRFPLGRFPLVGSGAGSREDPAGDAELRRQG